MIARLDWWELTPAETAALKKAWKRKERRESTRWANLMACELKCSPDELLPDDDSPEGLAAEHARLADYLKTQNATG
jgi:hypothetical protein